MKPTLLRDGNGRYVVFDGERLVGQLHHVWTTGGSHVWRGGHVNGESVGSWNRTRKEALAHLLRIDVDFLKSTDQEAS